MISKEIFGKMNEFGVTALDKSFEETMKKRVLNLTLIKQIISIKPSPGSAFRFILFNYRLAGWLECFNFNVKLFFDSSNTQADNTRIYCVGL